MSNNIVFTIGREFGSGGREIGKRLSDELSIPFYDKELISLAAHESDLCEEVIYKLDEKPVNSLLYSMSMGTYSFDNRFPTAQLPLNDKLFLVQANLIERIAKEGSCVIIGRCADYILRENEDTFNVFIQTSLQDKVDRIRKLYDIPEKKLEDFVKKTNKQRKSYYNYYSGYNWGDAKTYDMVLNSSIGIQKCVDILKFVAESKMK